MKRNNSGEGSLLEHLEALRGTLWRSVFAVAVMLVPALYFSQDLLTWIVRYTCPAGLKLHYFSPFEPLFIQLNIGLAAAIVAAAPFILHQLALFIAPGLYPHEKRTLGAFCFFALLLSLCGIALGFFFVIPQVMTFSLSFATEELQPVIGLGNFLKLVIWMLVGFALVFELPIALLVPVRLGVLSTQTLKKWRFLFVCGIFFIAALLTPPDVVSQLALGIPGWLLFEVTLLFARAAEKKAAASQEEEEETDLDMETDDMRSAPSAVEEKAVVKTTERSRLASKNRKIRKL